MVDDNFFRFRSFMISGVIKVISVLLYILKI